MNLELSDESHWWGGRPHSSVSHLRVIPRPRLREPWYRRCLDGSEGVMKSNIKDCSAIEAIVKMSCRRYCSAPEADETADRVVRHRIERKGVPK